MDSALTRPPNTPPRAKSVGPSRPHRDSMEDADSSATRKRPRLDSGDRARRSMSADRLRDTATDSDPPGAPSTSPDGQLSSPPPEAADRVPPMSLTPSKVTINVREPANISPTHTSTQVNATSSLRGGDGRSDAAVGDQDFSGKMDSPSPNVISVGSSPPQSPEIEVAEVEDMTDEPGETRWKPVIRATSALEAKHTQRALMTAFPFGQQMIRWRKTLSQLAGVFEKNDIEDGTLFGQLAHWIETYLRETEPHTTQWWDMYREEREFWDEFPLLLEALARRNRVGTNRQNYLGNIELSGDDKPLQSFLVSCASLVMRMVQIDLQTLGRQFEANITPDLISDRYVNAVACIMDFRLPFWRSPVDTSRYDSKVTITAIISSLMLPPSNGIACLKHLSQGILELCHHSPGLLPKLFAPLNLANSAMDHYRRLQTNDTEVDRTLLMRILEAPPQAYQIFRVVDDKLQTFISKQNPALSIEISQNLIWRLSLLLKIVANSDKQLTRGYMNEELIHDGVRDNRAVLLGDAWKFHTLKRCILEGRMEIRVHGVDSMDRELVEAYNIYVKDRHTGIEHPNHPIAQYLSDFLLANKLVDYFVGVESHPQLISRCANIIGFLVVTHRYTEAETNIIWKAVTTSQDSRFVDALLGMLAGIFTIAKYPTLLYLTAKLNEIPIHAFDGSMIGYAQKLFTALIPKLKEFLSDDNTDMQLRQGWKETLSSQRMDMPPYYLCIRLIRQCQSATESTLEPQRKRDIHHFATHQLRTLLPFGPSDTDKRAIYDECLKDISGQTNFATGSVSAIHALLAQNDEREFALLSKDSDLTSLLVDELAHMIGTERSSQQPSQMFDERLEIRLQLLQHIIMYVPDTFTAKTGTQLWNVAVGSEALHDRAREAAWMCFIRAMRYPIRNAYPKRNVFIDQCVRDLLPRLEPHFYTDGCLQFVQDAVHYHSRMAAMQQEPGAKQDSTAGLLWQLSLTAPPNTIENKAIRTLVAFYLDSLDVPRRSRAATEAIHIEVVERCIRQLTSAASKLKAFSDGTSSGEDEPMVIVASEEEVHLQRLSFSRSLMILHEFVQGVRSHPKYSPQPQSQRQLPHENAENKGYPIQIRYQAFGGIANSDIRTVEVGDLETIQEFSRRLTSLTGFAKLNLIVGGMRLDLAKTADQTLQELKIDQKGLLLVKRVAEADAVPDLAPALALRPVEKEILNHFSELYQLLTMEDNLGTEVFDFLGTFEPHSSITTLVCSKDTPLETMFPPTAPFKTRYSIYAFKRSLEYQSHIGSTNPDLTCHGIRSLTTALSSLNLNIGPHGADVDITIAKDIVECLQLFLKEPISHDSVESLFINPVALVNRLNALVMEAQDLVDNKTAGDLACASFSVLLQISLLSEVLWSHFKAHVMCSTLLQRSLLEDHRSEVRTHIAESIKSVRGISKTSPTVPAREVVPYLWQNLFNIVSFCLDFADSSEQFFDVITELCKSMDRTSCSTLDLATYAQNWAAILLQHVHHEFVGRETRDWIVIGLSRLLKWCFAKAHELGKPLSIRDNFLEKLFRAHLFPDPPNIDMDDDTQVETRIPNLYTGTRTELYDVILVMSNDKGNYQKLLMLVEELLSQGEDSQAWSCGFAQPLEGNDFEPNFNFERAKCLRSELGYPGMRNLSNTCYMNSLFTQLFMNVGFRSFMLRTKVADGTASQRLLHETQNLFGFMQETTLRSVDSSGIADSLITYDNTLIDVSVQMDVDEFYNLLFDRWESQILSEADKKKFRAFYGGQIVQQIKSKDCDHISERLEPFSAIQCDIQGKIGLIDSLNAYVTGEVMEGDNKYACTSCGCYVDAVKRACLKDIPDNLIFHLKRFDFDVMSGMRSKINDLFEFPDQVDMAPYHVDYLKDPQQPCTPDMFELVGVLVHSGNAESGHYYSYIKERPSTSSNSKRWVEFNDTDVTEFNPDGIADHCFGGWTEHVAYAPRYLKSWNAYMLFYERMNSPKSHNDNGISTSCGVPAKCAMSMEIERRAALENANWLRHYCLFDPAHAKFARQVLEQLRVVNKGTCSDDHETERTAIWQSLDYLQVVLSRSKDSTAFGVMLASLTNVIGACPLCCKLALVWVVEHKTALRNVLLRCLIPKVRKDFANMISIALQYLRKTAPQDYGFQDIRDENLQSSKRELREGGIFPQIVHRLRELWDLVLQQSRGWDDYFGLLADLANIGDHETHVILYNFFLQGCLEILCIDHHKYIGLRNENSAYATYVRLSDKGRKYSFCKLTELIAHILTRIDLRASPTRRGDKQFIADGMRLSMREDTLMLLGNEFHGSKHCCVFLQKILDTGGNIQAIKKIVRAILLAEPELRLLEPVQHTIINGVNVEPANMAAPFLQAAITFCECTPKRSSAEQVIGHIAKEVDTIGNNGGREHLDFFINTRRLRSLHNGIPEGFFNRCVLVTVSQWAPTLLMYWEDSIRNNTLDLLKTLLFGHNLKDMDEEEHADTIYRVGRELQKSCLQRCYIQVETQKTIDGRSVEQVVQVIKHCLETYYEEDEVQPKVEADNILGSLEALTASDLDEAASDAWNNPSDDMPTDSDSEYAATSP